MMVTETEVRQIKEELEHLTGFISDYGNAAEQVDKESAYACDIIDALGWVLGEPSTERFRTSDFLNIKRLEQIVRIIEQRTGENFEKYKSILLEPRPIVSEEQLRALIAKAGSKSTPQYRKLKGHLIRQFEQKTGKKWLDTE